MSKRWKIAEFIHESILSGDFRSAILYLFEMRSTLSNIFLVWFLSSIHVMSLWPMRITKKFRISNRLKLTMLKILSNCPIFIKPTLQRKSSFYSVFKENLLPGIWWGCRISIIVSVGITICYKCSFANNNGRGLKIAGIPI